MPILAEKGQKCDGDAIATLMALLYHPHPAQLMLILKLKMKLRKRKSGKDFVSA